MTQRDLVALGRHLRSKPCCEVGAVLPARSGLQFDSGSLTNRRMPDLRAPFRLTFRQGAGI